MKLNLNAHHQFNVLFVLLLSMCSCQSNNDPIATPTPSCSNTTVSFATDIKPIIETSCLINNSQCHGKNLSIPNWANFSEVQAKAALIKTKTGNRSMPKIGSLSQAQIDLIACWVDNGAQNN